jgi:hypothetical protein
MRRLIISGQLRTAAVHDLSTVLWDDTFIERRWSQSAGYMSALRQKAQGPRFLRLGARCVRYRPQDVIDYENAHEFGSTAESLASDFKAPPSSPVKPSSPFAEPLRKRISPPPRKKNDPEGAGSKSQPDALTEN